MPAMLSNDSKRRNISHLYILFSQLHYFSVIELPCDPPTVEVKVIPPTVVPRASRIGVSMINDFTYKDNCQATDAKKVCIHIKASSYTTLLIEECKSC